MQTTGKVLVVDDEDDVLFATLLTDDVDHFLNALVFKLKESVCV